MEVVYAVLAHPVLVPHFKVGWTDNFERRLSQIRRLNPGHIEVLRTIPGTRAQEQEILQALREYKDHHEWHYDSEYVRTLFSSLCERL